MIYIPHEAGVGKPLERGTRLWEIHSLIGPHPDESIIDGQGISRIVISGVQTEVCIDTTCRRALRAIIRLWSPMDIVHGLQLPFQHNKSLTTTSVCFLGLLTFVKLIICSCDRLFLRKN